MRLRHIEVFQAIMQTGSVSAAAKLINVSQPAATRTLLHAETQLGFKLFSRIKGRLYPTPEATKLFGEVAKVSIALENVRELAQTLKAGSKGHVRVAATPTLCQDLVPLAIQKLRAAHSDVTCAMEMRFWKEIVNGLLTGETDVAFAIAPPSHPALCQKNLLSSEMVAAFPRSEAPKAGHVSLRELAKYPFVALKESGQPFSIAFRSACNAQKVNLRPVVQVQTNYSALWFVAAGVGVAVIDEYTAARAALEKVSLRILKPALKFNVAALYAKHRPPGLQVEHLIKSFANAGRETSIQCSRLLHEDTLL